jgi:hypothetical protein
MESVLSENIYEWKYVLVPCLTTKCNCVLPSGFDYRNHLRGTFCDVINLKFEVTINTVYTTLFFMYSLLEDFLSIATCFGSLEPYSGNYT